MKDDHNARDAALSKICAHAREFYRLGWLYGTSGNFSIRDSVLRRQAQEDDWAGEGFWITITGRHKAELTPEDFLHCDADGLLLDDTDVSSSSDTAIHRTLYDRRTDIGAVYHAHHIEATCCGERDWSRGFTEFSGIEMLKGLGITDPADLTVEIPVLPNEKSADDQATIIADYIDSDRFDPRVPGVNVHRHGLYVWGDDPFEARRHLETFAYLFEYDRARGA